jgi:hypothetical protein
MVIDLAEMSGSDKRTGTQHSSSSMSEIAIREQMNGTEQDDNQH